MPQSPPALPTSTPSSLACHASSGPCLVWSSRCGKEPNRDGGRRIPPPRDARSPKDLCLRQREEIRTLKHVVLFLHVEPEPELDRRLRDDISMLTDQIQCLTQELAAQVKAEKHSARSCFDEDGYCSSPRTSGFNEDTAFSLECNIGEAETPNYGSPDEMFSKDLNPCLTNYFGE
ncbi:hypothetical protein Zm00014a_027599 [Zea mays]|uniref:Uncharacterized protein n=1 Tax=Zea mays TaxID=4577 RepID=A0A3L6FJB3_MAIZE|nr:hypothetical protein Zm00014a_027599 [Zea mays]